MATVSATSAKSPTASLPTPPAAARFRHGQSPRPCAWWRSATVEECSNIETVGSGPAPYCGTAGPCVQYLAFDTHGHRLRDITEMLRVRFVMKGGEVFRNDQR